MLRRAPVVALTLLLSLAPFAAAQEQALTSGERLLDEALATTRDHWWDRKARRTIDWDGLRARYRREAASAATPVEAHRVVNKLFAELKTSHLALMEGTVYDRELDSEFKGKPSRRAGVELVELGGGTYVGSVLESSPAEKAGLRVGDEVLSINGRPPAGNPVLEDGGHDPGLFLPPSYVLRVLSPRKDEAPTREYVLEVRHVAQGPVATIRFEPTDQSMIEAARASVRIVEAKGRKLGVVHLWHFMSPEMARLLRDALKGPLASADGLVLDVRGRGGRSDVIWQVMGQFGPRGTWKKPVVVLTDHGTRSAKEIFAWAWKKQGLGTIVGERTAGAVIGCQFKRLFDGSVLMYPAQDVRPMTKGDSLEGRGVEPDVTIESGDLRWRNGRDPILERGQVVLLEQLKKVRVSPIY